MTITSANPKPPITIPVRWVAHATMTDHGCYILTLDCGHTTAMDVTERPSFLSTELPVRLLCPDCPPLEREAFLAVVGFPPKTQALAAALNIEAQERYDVIKDRLWTKSGARRKTAEGDVLLEREEAACSKLRAEARVLLFRSHEQEREWKDPQSHLRVENILRWVERGGEKL